MPRRFAAGASRRGDAERLGVLARAEVAHSAVAIDCAARLYEETGLADSQYNDLANADKGVGHKHLFGRS